jgi:SAM-dependent methyltransferase
LSEAGARTTPNPNPDPAAQNAPRWWQSYFSASYAALYRGPLADELTTDDDVANLARLFAHTKGPILDLGCGYGRHLRGLRAAGLDAFGIDYSEELLREAPRRLQKFTARGDMKSLPIRDASIAAVAMMFNTFGYFDDESNGHVLAQIQRILQPGGLLVMDIPCRAGMVAVVDDVPAAISHRGNVSIYESWFVSDDGKRLLGRGSWELKGRKQEWELSLRLHSPAEITRLLRRAGFTDAIEVRPLDEMHLLGAPQPCRPLSDSTWRRTTNMVVMARKPARPTRRQ